MTKGKHLTDKHGKDVKADPVVAAKIKEKAKEGQLPCAVAFKIAEELKIKPSEVGMTLDLLEIKIIKCQIGIFGYDRSNKTSKPMAHVPDALKTAIGHGLTGGKLPCAMAWQIAETLGLGKMDIGSACDAMGIKISPCQLGAF
jgi:hypothetical protein